MNNSLIISHQSALLVHRAVGARMLEPLSCQEGIPVGQHTCRVTDFLDSGNISGLLECRPLHLLALSQNSAHSIKGCTIHKATGRLPTGSFRSLGSHVLVSSPALVLLQMCQSSLTSFDSAMPWASNLFEGFGEFGMLVALAELCGELCGYYSLAPDGTGSIGRHRPFTTKHEIQRYLSEMIRAKGLKLSRRALAAAPPLSASPRETAIFLVMTAPWPLGYGFEAPSTNEPILLKGQSSESDEDCATIRFSDYMWASKTLRNGRRRRCVTLEYDSDEFHTASAGLTDQHLKDQAERRDAIETAGNGYLRLTTDHTRDFEMFEHKMRQLARLLRVDLPQRSDDEKRLAMNFQQVLFDSTRFKSVGNLVLPSASVFD